MAAPSKHIVKANEGSNFYSTCEDNIHTVRFVVQMDTGGNTEMNHVSLYLLLLRNGKSVRVNMRTEGDSSRGYLEYSCLNYQVKPFWLSHFDIRLCAVMKVNQFCSWLKSEDLHKFMFSPLGKGCRHWVYLLLERMERRGLVPLGSASQAKHDLSFHYYHGSTSVQRTWIGPFDEGSLVP